MKLKTYPDLIPSLRSLLITIDKPYVIENVMGAPLFYPIRLNGLMFGLRVLRDRLFETSPWMLAPGLPKRPPGRLTADLGEYDRGQYGFVGIYGRGFNKEAGAQAMGIDWMTKAELTQAIPPAYTEWIGEQLLAML
jgi:DNA (cytosine-5)-methyltransferase 1